MNLKTAVPRAIAEASSLSIAVRRSMGITSFPGGRRCRLAGLTPLTKENRSRSYLTELPSHFGGISDMTAESKNETASLSNYLICIAAGS